MDFLTEIWTAWNEQWGVTIATILALTALLKSAGKEIKQLGSAVWHWKGWTVVSRLYRKVLNLYKVRRARSVLRGKLETSYVRIPIGVFENCLRDDPRKSTRSQLNAITPAKPSWLNDYYVAIALESLSNEGIVVKARSYSMKFWPPDPESYFFRTVGADTSARDEAAKIEANNICVVYQHFNRCPRPSRFEPHYVAVTVSPTETRHTTTYPLKDMAPPCDLCWEQESRERDIRMLVDNITKYDLADIASAEITGTDGELQEVVVDTCIKSQCAAEVNFIKSVVKKAIDIRQGQIARNTLRPEQGWLQGEREELVAILEEYIKSQTVG